MTAFVKSATCTLKKQTRQTSRCNLVEDTEKKKKGEGGKMEISEFSLRRDIIYLDYQGGFRKFQV